MKNDYLTIPELAKILGISRIAVYNKVRAGQIKAKKIGRMFVIPKNSVPGLSEYEQSKEEKIIIEKAVKKTVKEYGQVLKLLGQE